MVEPRTVCCIKWKLQKFCIAVLTVESLAVIGTLVFFVPSLIRGLQTYQQQFAFLATIILYQQLVYYIVFQSLWLLSNAIALLAVHCVVPYLLLPHFICSTIVFIVGAILLGYTIDRLSTWPNESTSGIVFLVLLALLILIEMYITSIKLRCFRLLVKRRKAVQGTCEDKPAVVAEHDTDSSYSRRSTVCITDEYYEPPPKI